MGKENSWNKHSSRMCAVQLSIWASAMGIPLEHQTYSANTAQTHSVPKKYEALNIYFPFSSTFAQQDRNHLNISSLQNFWNYFKKIHIY